MARPAGVPFVFPSHSRWSQARIRELTAVTLAALVACGGPLRAEPPASVAPAGRREAPSHVGLGGHVLPALARAKEVRRLQDRNRTAPAAPSADDEPLTLTVVLARDDEAAFQRLLFDIYDPKSPSFRKFLSPGELADRFGPSPQSYAAVRSYLEERGMTLVAGSASRLTLTVRTTRGAAQEAFHVSLVDYEMNGRLFYANGSDPELPRDLGPKVQAVIGLNNLARPQDLTTVDLLKCLEKIDPDDPYPDLAARICFDLWFTGAVLFGIFCFWDSTFSGVKSWGYFADCLKAITTGARPHGKRALANPALGAGQKIGLLEFDSFHASDVDDLAAALGLPAGTSAKVIDVKVNGGAAIGAGETEVLLDIGLVTMNAPGATFWVYEAPFSTSFQTLFSAMIDDGMTVVSNSWSYCEDQTTLADVQSMESLFATAAAAGIGIFNASGDTGGTCLDGSPNTAGVPADAPHATAVGGTSVTIGPNLTYGGETWWAGRGGYGRSRFFARPSYQNGFTTAAGRSVPDVSAPADPATSGVPLCQADRGGCPTPFVVGGTSMSAPTWAAYEAVLNGALGVNLGWMNPHLYPLAGTSAFNSPASLGSDFSHVGLGSANVNLLLLALAGQAPGAGDGALSQVRAVPARVVADGVAHGSIVVQLRDAGGSIVPGKTISLQKSGGSAQISPGSAVTSNQQGVAVFSVTDAVIENVTFTAHDDTDGVTLTDTALVRFVSRPATTGGLVASPTSVPANGASSSTITVTLLDGNGNGTPNKVVTLSQGSGHSVIAGPVPAVTDAGGQLHFTVTDGVVETVIYTAVDVTDGNLPIPTPASVGFTGATTSCASVSTPAAGYTLTSFANGFFAQDFNYGGVNWGGCPGASNPTFGSDGSMFVADFRTGGLYKLTSGGGTVSDADKLSSLGLTLGQPTFGKDGRLYATHGATTGNFTTGDIVEVNPATGAQIRVVAANLTCPNGLAVDPLSGDLFFDDACSGGGADNASLFRIHDPAGAATLSSYATLPGTPNGAIAFAPDGTIYVSVGYFVAKSVVRVAGTDKTQPPAMTTLAGINSGYWITMGEAAADGSAKSLLVNSANALKLVDITTGPFTTTTLATGSISSGTIGPDGCLYGTGSDTIYKVAPSVGGCLFSPTTPASTLGLSPAVVAPNPAQGTPATFTAQLAHVPSAEGTPVFFLVGGANAYLQVIAADATGKADFTYVGGKSGSDVVTAEATVGGLLLRSNPGRVTWTPGKHTIFLDLSKSPGGALATAVTTLKAELKDLSQTPVAPLAGASVHFTVDGLSCDGVTNASGLASCNVIPAAQGQGHFTLTATYAGSGTTLPASASIPFVVLGTLRGDANGDGTRDIADVFYLINTIFAAGPMPATLCRGDANSDGIVDISDVFYLLNVIFADSPPPLAC